MSITRVRKLLIVGLFYKIGVAVRKLSADIQRIEKVAGIDYTTHAHFNKL